MTEPFKYSFDQDTKSRIEAWEDEHPYQDLHGLSEWQIEMLLGEVKNPIEDDDLIPDKATDAAVSVSTNKVSTNLTIKQMRAVLKAHNVTVGARGILTRVQMEKAITLSQV